MKKSKHYSMVTILSVILLGSLALISIVAFVAVIISGNSMNSNETVNYENGTFVNDNTNIESTEQNTISNENNNANNVEKQESNYEIDCTGKTAYDFSSYTPGVYKPYVQYYDDGSTSFTGGLCIQYYDSEKDEFFDYGINKPYTGKINVSVVENGFYMYHFYDADTPITIYEVKTTHCGDAVLGRIDSKENVWLVLAVENYHPQLIKKEY